MPQEEDSFWTRKLWYYLNFITVEPTLYLYMMAFMITSVLENAFFIDKACLVNHNFTKEICDDLKEHEELNKEVQVTVSNFNFKNDIAGHTGQILLAFFMGAWSDKRGRKWPLLLGLCGKLYYSVMIVVNSVQATWPVEYIVYTATLPMAFTGADVAIFAAAFTYLVDVSSSENRTLRVTLLEVIYLSTMPTGIALGSYLFRKVFPRSYSIMFGINCGLMLLAILYSLVRLQWRTTQQQRPLKEAKNVFVDFFDYRHVVNTFKVMGKKREDNRRTYLLLLITMMGLYTFQRDEKNSSYLYLSLVFKWTFGQISNFRTFQSALQDLGLLIMIPFMSKVLGWRDTIIIMIGAFAHTIARVFFITANTDWLFYIGGVFAGFGPIVAPVIRSMVSKIVPSTEKGTTFSILSVADNAIPIISGTMYSKLYNYSIHTNPHDFFYLTMVTQAIVFVLITFVHFKTWNNENALIHVENVIEEDFDSEISVSEAIIQNNEAV